MRQAFVKSAICFGCVLLFLPLNGCKTTAAGIHIGWRPELKAGYGDGSKKVVKGGPPAHAPAHGYRAKHAYRYYPSSCVYFDASKKVYFTLRETIGRRLCCCLRRSSFGLAAMCPSSLIRIGPTSTSKSTSVDIHHQGSSRKRTKSGLNISPYWEEVFSQDFCLLLSEETT